MTSCLLRLLFLFALLATLTVCSNNDPSGPSDEPADPARGAVIGTPRGPLPVPPPKAPLPPKAEPPPDVGPPAQLTIVKTAFPADVTIPAGDPVRFDIRVTNNGPGTAIDVHLTDNLPHLDSNWTFSVTAGESIGCTIIGPATLFCGSHAHPGSPEEPPLPATHLAPGQFFSVRVSSPTDEDDCGTVTNTAQAFADNAPTVSDSASHVIICPPPPE